MNVRTTIMLERPLLDRIRRQARVQGKTLREAIRGLLLAGLGRATPSKAKLPPLPTLRLGREKCDISQRARLYELWDESR